MAAAYGTSEPQERLSHPDTCASSFARSVFDKSCPRCAQIGKVIHLLRKTADQGCSENEAMVAKLMASRIAAKYALKPVELIDRAYGNETRLKVEPPVRRAARRRRKDKIIEDY